jgi:hypothetical protein
LRFFTGGVSQPIHDDQIQNIRKLITNAAAWRLYPFPGLGQQVRVCDGAMNGVEGVFLSENGDHSLVIFVHATTGRWLCELMGTTSNRSEDFIEIRHINQSVLNNPFPFHLCA